MLNSYGIASLEEAEKMGGDCRETLDILLKDLYMWKRRVLSYQKKKQYIRQECRLSVLMAAGLCYLSRWIIPVDLVRSGRILWAYQCSAVTAGLIFIGLDVWMRRRLSGPWNSEKEILSERESQSVTRQYERLQRGKRALFARKICGSEVSREFPYWILTVTLYLQQDSVYQAIIHATGQFQGVMEQEIRKLLRGIYEDPLSIQPYHDFFRALDLPDVKTGMKLLYAISQNGPQDAGRQIYFLVDQNMEMMDQSEQKQFDKQLAGFEFLKQIPMAAAGIKIVADMLIFLMAFMGSAAGGL